jgi:hypothetical protein
MVLHTLSSSRLGMGSLAFVGALAAGMQISIASTSLS